MRARVTKVDFVAAGVAAVGKRATERRRHKSASESTARRRDLHVAERAAASLASRMKLRHLEIAHGGISESEGGVAVLIFCGNERKRKEMTDWKELLRAITEIERSLEVMKGSLERVCGDCGRLRKPRKSVPVEEIAVAPPPAAAPPPKTTPPASQKVAKDPIAPDTAKKVVQKAPVAAEKKPPEPPKQKPEKSPDQVGKLIFRARALLESGVDVDSPPMRASRRKPVQPPKAPVPTRQQLPPKAAPKPPAKKAEHPKASELPTAKEQLPPAKGAAPETTGKNQQTRPAAAKEEPQPAPPATGPPPPTPFEYLPGSLRKFLHTQYHISRPLLVPSQQLTPRMHCPAASKFLGKLPNVGAPSRTTLGAKAYAGALRHLQAACSRPSHQVSKQKPATPKVCTWLGIWLPSSITSTEFDIEQVLFPQGTVVDEFGRSIMKFENERALRRHFQARHSLQTTISKLLVEDALSKALIPLLSSLSSTVREEGNSTSLELEWLSLLRAAHSVICRDGCEPFTVTITR